jgi:thiol-disulfide isomerase/thioredoxin
MSRKRRQALMIGAAGTASAAVGLWWAWRAAHPAPAATGAPDLWTLRFEQPQGGELLLADLRGKPLVLNFWATWCPPCIKEMPELNRFHREFAGRGWQVLGLAADSAAAVRSFLAGAPVGYPIGLAGFAGIELSRLLGNTSGALPYTVVLGAKGQVLHQKLGETDFDELAAWARAL